MRRKAGSSGIMINGGHQYQWLTAYDRQRMEGHRLDWPGQPSFFKHYSPSTSYSLPLPERLPQVSLFTLAKNAPAHDSLIWNRHSLAALLLLTSAPTARSSFAEGEIWYRSNASAGALHPLEFYLSFPGAADLPAGIYHYDLLKPALNRLRCDPASKVFAAACGYGEDDSAGFYSPVLLISAIMFRSAWKYRARAYRYLLLDAGHALENMVIGLQALGADFEVVLNFDDTLINQGLGFDAQREVGLAAVRLGADLSVLSESESRLQVSDPEPDLVSGSRVSTREVDYPLLREIHLVSSVSLPKMPIEKQIDPEFYQNLSEWQVIPENIIPAKKSILDYTQSLRQRRSRRNFVKSETLTELDDLYCLLSFLGQSLNTFALPVPEIIFLVSGVCGLADGIYLFAPFSRRFALLEGHDQRLAVAAAALDQRWLERAALQFVFFADLESAQELYGPRSYRSLQIAAGRWGQRLYLGATALGLGCCAVGAFYDRELAQACCLPENFDPLYLVAAGPVAGS
ncbi:MAG: SagB/ThcOx family dehydrogenase [Deltaproteobacteria bacterium]|nr:SagB/ThcOx family dehydrogenase [Candidatus Tharpella sp.]